MLREAPLEATAVSLPAREAPPLSRDVTRPPTERPPPASTPDDIRYLDSVDPKREHAGPMNGLPHYSTAQRAEMREAVEKVFSLPAPRRAALR